MQGSSWTIYRVELAYTIFVVFLLLAIRHLRKRRVLPPMLSGLASGISCTLLSILIILPRIYKNLNLIDETEEKQTECLKHLLFTIMMLLGLFMHQTKGLKVLQILIPLSVYVSSLHGEIFLYSAFEDGIQIIVFGTLLLLYMNAEISPKNPEETKLTQEYDYKGFIDALQDAYAIIDLKERIVVSNKKFQYLLSKEERRNTKDNSLQTFLRKFVIQSEPNSPSPVRHLLSV
jgi:PAS domain-containing protein